MIPKEVIYQIRDADLVSILQGEGLELKREGANYKCCCPFHGEKTPSFVVSPSRNLAHCFGGCAESWDAISFVMRKNSMTFYEAVEYLAAKLHIQYEKREPTPEEREAQHKAEQLMSANQTAHEWFVSRLAASPGAQEYCKQRGWSEQTLTDFGVGFAPAKGGLYEHMTSKGWKREVLQEAGLVKISEDGRYYDAFRERLIFPLYSATGQLVGFSGRYVGDNPEVAKKIKYLNTSETPIYQKRAVLFGWYQAARKVSVSQTVVICEGNPDVLRLSQIGITNAIAPCGTALTDEHIEFLKARKVKSVILAGDMDESGIKASIKHGIDFIKAGMGVRIIRWAYTPKVEPADPKDPDEYFLRFPNGWDEVMSRDTFDFIPWYAEHLMAGKTTQAEVSSVITDVAQLLAYCDATAVEMFLDSFTKKYKNGKIWRQEYFKAKNARERKEIDQDDKTKDMLARYGFYVKGRCYYGAGATTADRPWSNFIMEPILHIRDERNARRIFRVINDSGHEEIVKFQQSELVSFTDFKRILESAGNYIWKVTAAELTQLKTYLYDDTPSADEIRQLGWQKRWGFYAFGNGGLDGDHFVKADKYGVFKMNDRRFYLPGCAADTSANTQGYQIDRKFTYLEANDVTLQDYVRLMVTVYGDNAKIGFCFLLATLFKDIVTHVTTSFPILNLFGPKGTGKSQLGHSLTSFFYTDYTAPNLAGSTKAALAEAVAEVSNAVVHLDEYKKELSPDKQEILKGIWDGTGRTRINLDNDKRRETTAVDCGVVVSGQEMPTADIALFSRMVFLTFNKTTFSDEEKQNFERLTRIEKRGLTHLTAQMLKLRPTVQGGYRTAWDDTVSDLSDLVRTSAVEDRTLKNWATILAAFRVLDEELQLPFHYGEMLNLCARMCVAQNAQTRQSNEVSVFWGIIENIVGSSKAWIEVDYRILPGGRSIKTKESKKAGTLVELNPNRRYLYVNFNRLSSLYMKEARDTQHAIPKETLEYYLQNSPEYVGSIPSMKFKLIDNQLGYTPQDPNLTKTRVTTAMVFDYDAIVDNYAISLEVATGYHESDAGHESQQEPKEDPPVELPEDLPLF